MSAIIDLAAWEDEIGDLAQELRSVPDADGAFEIGVRLAGIARALVDLAAASAGSGGAVAPTGGEGEVGDEADLICMGGAEAVSVLGEELLLAARESGGQLRIDVTAGEVRWHVDVGEPDAIGGLADGIGPFGASAAGSLSGSAEQIAGGLARDAKRALERKGRAALAAHGGPAGAVIGELASAADHLSVSVQAKDGASIEVIRRPGAEPMSREDLEADELQRFEEHLDEVAEQIDPDVDGLLEGDESALSGTGAGAMQMDVEGAVGTADGPRGAGVSGLAAGGIAAATAAAGAAVARKVAKPRAAEPAEAPGATDQPAASSTAADVAATTAGVDDTHGWSCTHVVPSTGLASWDVPDGSTVATASLAAEVQLQVVETSGAWARVRGENGWEGWVDHRLLVPIVVDAPVVVAAPVAPVVVAAPVVPDAPSWVCTHLVPATGMACWDVPDGSSEATASLAAEVQLQVVETRGAWARVRGWNGWEGWVDHRLLVPSGGDR